MATMNVSLPDSLRAFVEAEVAEGGYSTASEYVRELLRQAQRQKAQEKLEALLVEGLESGEAAQMSEADWQEIRRQVEARVARRKG